MDVIIKGESIQVASFFRLNKLLSGCVDKKTTIRKISLDIRSGKNSNIQPNFRTQRSQNVYQ
jgi:hypothetical protein